MERGTILNLHSVFQKNPRPWGHRRLPEAGRHKQATPRRLLDPYAKPLARHLGKGNNLQIWRVDNCMKTQQGVGDTKGEANDKMASKIALCSSAILAFYCKDHCGRRTCDRHGLRAQRPSAAFCSVRRMESSSADVLTNHSSNVLALCALYNNHKRW